MRKGTRQFLWVSLLLLPSAGWLVVNQLAAQAMCRRLSALAPQENLAEPHCSPSRWLWPGVRFGRSRTLFTVGAGEARVEADMEQGEAELDVRQIAFRQSLGLRLKLHHVRLFLSTDRLSQSTGSPLPLLAALVAHADRFLVGSPISSTEIYDGAVFLQTTDHAKPTQLLAREFELSFKQDARGSRQVVFRGVLGEHLPAQLDLLIQPQPESTRIVASGHLRVARHLFAQARNVEFLYTPASISVSTMGLSLNGAPVTISATFPRHPDLPGHVTVQWQNLRIGPVAGHLWDDLQGVLEGESSGNISASSPSLDSLGDFSRWDAHGKITGRRLHWSGVNLLYGFLERANLQISEQHFRDLLQTLRHAFTAELLPAETQVHRLEATVHATGGTIHFENVSLSGPRYQIDAHGTLALADGGPKVDATIHLTPATEIANLICAKVPKACDFGNHGGKLVFPYRWVGNPLTSLPVWAAH